MTIDEAVLRVAQVGVVANQMNGDADAHYEQDALFVEFIEHVAAGTGTDALIARKILEVKDIEFSRWYE